MYRQITSASRSPMDTPPIPYVLYPHSTHSANAYESAEEVLCHQSDQNWPQMDVFGKLEAKKSLEKEYEDAKTVVDEIKRLEDEIQGWQAQVIAAQNEVLQLKQRQAYT